MKEVFERLLSQGVSEEDARLAAQFHEVIAIFNGLALGDFSAIKFNNKENSHNFLAAFDPKNDNFVIFTRGLAKRVVLQSRQLSFVRLRFMPEGEDGVVNESLIVRMLAAHEVRHRLQLQFQHSLRLFGTRSKSSNDIAHRANRFVTRWLQEARKAMRGKGKSEAFIKHATSRQEHDAYVVGLVVMHSLHLVKDHKELKKLLLLEPD